MARRDNLTVDMWAPPKPEPVKIVKLGPEKDGLRHYQLECVKAIHRSFESNRSVLIVLATGLGKTQVFSSVAKHHEGRVLVLAHRSELVDQARARLEHMTGELVEVEQGQLRSGRARIVVGSLQTVTRPDRLADLTRKGGFSLVIVDEAHHLIAPTYRRPIDHFCDAKVLGVTATPDRGDGKAMAQVFDDVAFSMGIDAGVAQGYLVPFQDCTEVEVKEVSLDAISTRAGDLAAGELDDAMLQGVEGIVRGMLHHSGDRQGVMFFPGVKSAHMASERLNAIKPGSACSIDGETPPDERRALVDGFKAGRFQFMANCMIATEGFDAPSCSVIGLARPTKSRALYAQMCGRGTRVLPGLVEHVPGEEGAGERRALIAASKKPSLKLIDFVGLNTKHRLMTPYDLLGGDMDPPEVIAKAKELAEELDNVDKTAGEILDLSRLEIARLARSFESKVKSVSRKFDPFGAFGITEDAERKYALEYGYKDMDAKQRKVLEKFGFKDAELQGVSRHAASKLVSEVYRRIDAKLASRNQLAVLAKYGVSSPDVSFEAASKGIAYLAQNGWGKSINPATLRRIVEGK